VKAPSTMFHRLLGLRALPLLAVSALHLACVTPPKTYPIESVRILEASYDDVWRSLMRFFTTGNVMLKTVQKDSGVVYAEYMTFTDGQADCGTPGILMITGRTLGLNVFVEDLDGDSVRVSVNTRFVEHRRFDTTVMTVECNSKGTVERLILDTL
jgi:hypothetical protein